MKKEWKKVYIDGKPTHYVVSSEGDIKDLRKGDKLEKPKIDKSSGYLMISIKEDYLPNSFKSNFLVHRLVASAFIPNDNPSVNVVVNHKDGNRLNNSVENLEWCTQQYNCIDARNRNNNKNGTITISEAIAVADLLELGKYYFKEIAEIVGNGVTESIVRSIYNRRSWADVSEGRVYKKKKRYLDTNDIMEIANILAAGDMSDRAIADIYGVSNSTISAIRRKELHGDLTENVDMPDKKKIEFLSKETVLEIAKMLEEHPELTSVEIGKLFNCPAGKIDSIRERRSFVDLTKDFSFKSTEYFKWGEFNDSMIDRIERGLKPSEAYVEMGFKDLGISLETFTKHYYELQRRLKLG